MQRNIISVGIEGDPVANTPLEKRSRIIREASVVAWETKCSEENCGLIVSEKSGPEGEPSLVVTCALGKDCCRWVVTEAAAEVASSLDRV